MVSGKWSHDNIVYKMFALDLLHNAWSYYCSFIMTSFEWHAISEGDTLYGSKEWGINEMKRNWMFSRVTLGDTSQLTPLKDTKNRLQIQVNRLTHATSHSLQPART
jgi:hypothetical protein